MENKQGLKVLITGAILQFFLGIIYVWSVFVKPVSDHFEWAVDKVKLTSSFMLCCFVLGILIGGKLQVKVGTQKIVLTGGLLMAVGMLATSFIPVSVAWLIYITYGIIGGFGVGMAYNAIISCAQKWFPKKRGLATGISVCMFGFSTVVFAPLIEVLVGSVGLLNTLRILAGIFFIFVIALFSFIKLPEETGSAAAAAVTDARQYTTSEMLKTKQFYLIAFSMMFCTASYFILNPSFKTLAGERGLSDSIATLLVMITGIANTAGRLVVPLVSDKIGREYATFGILLITAISTGILCFANGVGVIVMIALIAFCYGGSSGIYPLVTGKYFGVKNIGSNYGAVMVGFAFSALLFPIIMNQITDPAVKFIVLAIVAAVGSILILVLNATNKVKK
jgi:Cyanate permease